MRAYWLPKHWPLGNVGAELSVDDLKEQGIELQYVSPDDDGRERAITYGSNHGYVSSDVVLLNESSAMLDAFSVEHHHATDEVRWVLDGTGVFDIRSLDDKWIRIRVVAGDFLVLPAKRWHLFLLDRKIRVTRLFGQDENWKAELRHPNTPQ